MLIATPTPQAGQRWPAVTASFHSADEETLAAVTVGALYAMGEWGGFVGGLWAIWGIGDCWAGWVGRGRGGGVGFLGGGQAGVVLGLLEGFNGRLECSGIILGT